MLASNDQILWTLNWFKSRHQEQTSTQVEDAYQLYDRLIKKFSK